MRQLATITALILCAESGMALPLIENIEPVGLASKDTGTSPKPLILRVFQSFYEEIWNLCQHSVL